MEKLASDQVLYFLDPFGIWYYVVPGPFRIAVPLKVVKHNIRSESLPLTGAREELIKRRNAFLRDIDLRILKRIRTQYKEDTSFRAYLSYWNCGPERFQEIMEKAGRQKRDRPTVYLHYRHPYICNYFYPWPDIVAIRDDTGIGVPDLFTKEEMDRL